MISETYVNELNQNISIYDLISFLGTANNNDNKLHLIMAKYKSKFNLKKDAYKNKVEL